MSNQKTRLHRLLNTPQSLRADNTWAAPSFSHYLPAFTQRRADGRQLSYCGHAWITAAWHSTEPTCPTCRRLLTEEIADRMVTALIGPDDQGAA